MSSEVFVCMSLQNERLCFKASLKHDEVGERQYLTEEEREIAEAAKQGAIEVLQDALKKKDKVLMKQPKKVVVTKEDKKQFFMNRHAVLTEDRVKKLLEVLKKVKFKKGNIMFCFAYVYPRDETRTIYLCSLFWDAPKYLERDSQPGTLIHEVSHFLGTLDLDYGNVKPALSVGCHGYMVNGSLSSASPPEENYPDALKKAFWNADNVEYEFELTLNHRGTYAEDKYSCCGETARYSVCARSVPDFFHTCKVGEKWETEKLVKELYERSQNIQMKLRQQNRTADEMEESLRKAEASRKVGLSMSTVGGGAALASLFLAPATLGLSVFMAGCAGVAVAGGALISTKILQARATTKKKELDDILAECQSFMDDVKRVIALLNYEAGFQRDFGIQHITMLINLMKEQVESERDGVQKIHGYMEGIIQCSHLLESLCNIFSE